MSTWVSSPVTFHLHKNLPVGGLDKLNCFKVFMWMCVWSLCPVVYSIPGIGSRYTATLRKIKWLLKMSERVKVMPHLFLVLYTATWCVMHPCRGFKQEVGFSCLFVSMLTLPLWLGNQWKTLKITEGCSEKQAIFHSQIITTNSNLQKIFNSWTWCSVDRSGKLTIFYPMWHI